MGRNRVEYTHSSDETIAVGQSIARMLTSSSIVCLYGDLGSGKTTLVKGIIHELTGYMPDEVCSPTFTYLNVYEGNCPVYHFDLYRLRDIEDFLGMGFEEYLFGKGVCCIEWSERIAHFLPKHACSIILEHAGQERRKIIYEIPKY